MTLASNDKFVSSKKNTDYKEGERITLICLIGNLLLCLVKYLAGIIGRSQAMIADATHSASDVVATVVVLLGVKIIQKPWDDNHHFGHGKIEFLCSTFVGFTLLYASIHIALNTLTTISNASFSTPSMIAVAAAVLSIVVKEAMYHVTMRVGTKLNSESIKANAWDHRSDALSSVGTFIGIGGSILGQHFGIAWLRYLDPIAAFIVALLIFKVAAEILIKAIQGLMDTSPNKEVIQKIRDISKAVPEVCEVGYVKARYTGPAMWIDMAIYLDETLSIKDGHDIAETVRLSIIDQFQSIDHIIIHVDPC